MPPALPAAPKNATRFDLRGHHIWVAVVLLVFAAFSVVRQARTPGSDLAPSYLGCRVMADGAQSHLYNHDPVLFNHVYDSAWVAAALEGGMAAGFGAPPYVQTPLWAWSLQPLCTHMNYGGFKELFLVLMMFCLVATIWLVAGHWTPRLFTPGWIALLCIGLYPTETFQYAMALVQTHILFVLLTVVALILAKRHPVDAGMMLALAAAVKITPGLLLFYWLITRQKKAALSFVVSSIALAAITVVAVGPGVSLAYLHSLSQNSHVLLVAFNNQSFAAWREGQHFPASELNIWHILRIPVRMKFATLGLSLLVTLWGGWMDRRATLVRLKMPPYGAIFAMVGATVFATIAWSHYYILLIIPVMLMLDAALGEPDRMKSAGLVVLSLAVLALNLYPLSWRMILMHPFVLHGHEISLVRSQFYSGLLAMSGMWMLAARARKIAAMPVELPRMQSDGEEISQTA
jgi:hypothetical protein